MMQRKTKWVGAMLALSAFVACAGSKEEMKQQTNAPKTEAGAPVVAEFPGSQGPVATVMPSKPRMTQKAPVQDTVRDRAAAPERRQVTKSEVTKKKWRSESRHARKAVKRRNTSGASSLRVAGALGPMTAEQRMMLREVVLNHLHHVNQKEIAMAKMAKEKSATTQVTGLADRVMADHEMLEQRVREVSDQEKIPLHSFQLATHEAVAMDRLQGLEGRNFDGAFVAAMRTGHEMTAYELARAEKVVNDPKLSALIKQTLPRVRQHAEISRKVNLTAR